MKKGRNQTIKLIDKGRRVENLRWNWIITGMGRVWNRIRKHDPGWMGVKAVLRIAYSNKKV